MFNNYIVIKLNNRGYQKRAFERKIKCGVRSTIFFIINYQNSYQKQIIIKKLGDEF